MQRPRHVSEHPVVGPRTNGLGTGKDVEPDDIGVYRRSRGFSLLEVMITILVILLGLVPLLHLLVRSIHVHEVSQNMARGILLAESQLSELLADSALSERRYQGQCEPDASGIAYRWFADVEPMSTTIIESKPLKGLWQVTLTLTWTEGRQDKDVILSTLIRNPHQIYIQTDEIETSSGGSLRGTP